MKQGWEIKKLGEVSEYFNGLTYSPRDVSDKGTIVLRSSNIQNDELDFSDLVRVNVNIKEKLFLKESDILMCSRNGSQRLVGKTAPILNLQEPMTFGTFMMIIRSEFSPYLLWFFKTDEFKKQISGGENTMINQVTRYMLDEIKIPLPPLPEQQRIVSKLDKAFSSIAKAKANAEQNLKNAKELFESYLQGVFEKKGDGWEERKLGESDLLEIIDGDRGKNYPTQKDFLEDGFCLFMNTKNVRPDGFEFETTMFISEAKDKAMGKGKLKRNDVVMTTRGTIGNLGVYDDSVEFENIRINSGMLIFRPNSKVITPHYLFETFRSGVFKAHIKKYTTGAAQPQLPIKTLVNFTIPVPKSIEEQQTIVRQLDALRTETQKLEAVYQKKLDDLEELKKSILQKAFAGELKVSEPLIKAD